MLAMMVNLHLSCFPSFEGCIQRASGMNPYQFDFSDFICTCVIKFKVKTTKQWCAIHAVDFCLANCQYQ